MTIQKLFYKWKKVLKKCNPLKIPQDIQKLEKIVQKKDIPIDTAINYFNTQLKKFNNITFERSLPCPATWNLVEYLQSIRKTIYGLYQKIHNEIY